MSRLVDSLPTGNLPMTASVTDRDPSRRDFLKASTVASAGTLLAGFAAAPRVHAAGDETLKVGLVGCGGRGSGDAKDALQADNYLKLVAVGDIFPEQIE